MTTIYLVEDEVYALRVLKQKIIDLNQDYKIIGSADNGITALEEIPLLSPDIVLTDIRMPDMDGLTMMEKLKKSGSYPLMIIVSGFQDFEYAKKAVHLGAFDYLLKPVDPAELSSCLQRCCTVLRKKRKNIFPFLIGDEKFSFEASSVNDQITLLYLIISNPLGNMETLLHPNVSYLPNESAENLFQSFLPHVSVRCYDGFFSNEKLFLLNCQKQEEEISMEQLLSLADLLERKTHKTLTLYYTHTSPATIPSEIRNARTNAVKNSIPWKTTVTNSLPPTQFPTANLLADTELYGALLQQGQFDQLKTSLRRKFQEWEKEMRTYPAVRDDLAFILDAFKRQWNSPKSLAFTSSFLLENIFSFSSSAIECADDFYRLLRELFTSCETDTKSASEIVSSLIDYFNNHLSSNITLQDLEDKIGFSKVYICRIFKKEKNTTPIDYFTRLKIDRAGKLLKEYPNLSLREISDSLGFNDVYYFSKVFKRITGKSPSELRK